jgi:hypothetical protein
MHGLLTWAELHCDRCGKKYTYVVPTDRWREASLLCPRCKREQRQENIEAPVKDYVESQAKGEV